MKVYEALAHALTDIGVKQLFGLIGDGNLFMVDSYLRDRKGKYIGAVHEAGAVLMALGYARVSEEIGVATVTHGPALTNTMTALVEGVKTATPMVLLAGDTSVDDREHAQKIDQRAFVEATGAGFELMRSPQTLTEDLVRAFYRAKVERRPVVFNMPIEFQWLEVDYVKAALRFPETRSVIAASTDMDNAIGIIASSHKPVIVGGRDARAPDVQAAILRLAERIGAPVATSVRGKGLFASDPFNLGLCGTVSNPVALEAIGGADCLIVFGASLNKFTGGLGGLTKGKRIIQINPEVSQIGRFTPVDAGLVGDPGLTADAMVKWLDEAEIPSSGYRSDDLLQKLKALRSTPPRLKRASAAGTVDLFELLGAVNQALPKDRVYVTDTGRFLFGAWPLIQVQNPRDYVDTIGFASIGLGVGAAIGAAAAAGGRTTLLVAGDGGFMLGGVSELATMAREQLDVVIVVCNDSSYGAEYIQYAGRNMDAGTSMHRWPEFAPIAAAFGFESLTVRSSEELKAAMAALAKRDKKRPFFIDAKLDAAALPHP
ncbi:MAG: thiamine pyrophosphate-binding protein [Burkholderiaceae bacterium]|jgi:thiamine pyrophosphate-dependent acetolactate synthase large subunit-like protein|nr:MAG: thiamine pyrophosphate-binding protein [Burkholderiaceae bacterium]